MVNKDLVKLHFSQKASQYDLYADLQRNMGSHLIQIAGLNKNEKGRKILDVGCGTGYMTHILSDIFPNGTFTLIDLSEGMLDICRIKFDNLDVSYLCTDAEDVNLQSKYDLIISNATFQWFNNLSKTVSKLVDHLNRSGILLFSTFGEKTFRELHISHSLAMKNMCLNHKYAPGQKFQSMDSIKQIVYKAFKRRVELYFEEEVLSVYFDSVRDFFKHVRNIGANNSSKHIHRSPGMIKELIKVYENRFSKGDKIKVTYHCIYGYARKL